MTSSDGWNADEMMTIAAARLLAGARTCFVGIGLPSTAANLARSLHAPDLVLVYESGTIGAKPPVLPLSIGDGILAETADAVVSVPEIFNYWLQAGRCDVGFLGAAQIDRFANVNTSTIRRTGRSPLRLPGAGGAPEIAAHAGRVLLTARHSPRVFVDTVDFLTTVGHGAGAGDRQRLGLPGAGPTAVITDLGVLEPHRGSRELVLSAVHPGVSVSQVRDATGWPLRTAEHMRESQPPTTRELQVLRELEQRTQESRSRDTQTA